MSIHDGHRARLRKRFEETGLDSFNEINALELALFYCIPRVDTNEIAHRLLDSFGSFSGVLEANVEDLQKVQGVGHNTAVFLTLLRDVCRYYQRSMTENDRYAYNSMDYGRILNPCFTGARDEKVYILCLDAKNQVICVKCVGSGSVNNTNVSLRKIMENVLAVNATSVVLAHNHPSGLAFPSQEDISTTLTIARALAPIGVLLRDHLVFTPDDYVSVVDSDMFDPREV